MKHFVTKLLLLAAVSFNGFCADKPNVVLVMIDDLGAEAIGCYGGESYPTPNIDALAKKGMRFENAYSMPACMPSRVTLLTGRYAFRSNLEFNKTQWIRDTGWGKGEITFANLLKDQGYATAISGKWQLCEHDVVPDHLDRLGFTHQNSWGWWRNDVTTRRFWGPTFYREKEWVELGPEEYGPDHFAGYLIDFMKEQKKQGKPFMAYYPMTLIHHPWPQTPDNKDVPQDGWNDQDNFLEHPHQKWSKPNFDAMIAYTDKVVGRMWKAVEDLGLEKDTLFILTSDNGTIGKVTSRYQGRDVSGGKMTVKESGSRVPLIAVWPGRIKAGSVNDSLVDFSDFLPTLVELAGAELPDDRKIDGVSFLGQLLGRKNAPNRDWVYSRYANRAFVRGRKYRLLIGGALQDMSGDRYDPRQIPMEQVRNSDSEAAQAYRKLKQVFESMDHKVGPGQPRNRR